MQSEVVAHSKTDPLLKDHFAREVLDLPAGVEVASLDNVGELRAYLAGSITSKRYNIRLTRKYLEKDPRLIWSLDQLQDATRLQSNVEPGSIYDSVLEDKEKE